MKVAILAGGQGTRLAEETTIKPKPMVEIAGRPILWHIMMHYSHFGFCDFVIALGYKGEHIKRYMLDAAHFHGDLTVRIGGEHTGRIVNRTEPHPPWTVQLVETGDTTQTGGRIKHLQNHLGDDTFMLTWGDGVSDVDLERLLAFHRSHGRLLTVTAVRPPARYGHLVFEGDRVVEFSEKPQTAEGWINGAFFVCEPGVFDYIDGEQSVWEREPMERIARDGELMAYRHDSFWQCMDTLRDKVRLEELAQQPDPPWMLWRQATTVTG